MILLGDCFLLIFIFLMNKYCVFFYVKDRIIYDNKKRGLVNFFVILELCNNRMYFVLWGSEFFNIESVIRSWVIFC